ncbi:MAG: hypothetical protein JXA13_12350 [Anaerolineales bacterium]|nr:hypothetical protein [Anaerolineales bacterium]
MDFFKRLSGMFTPRQEDFSFWLTVKCNRCSEVITTRVNLANDLSIEFHGDSSATYHCRKIIMGEGNGELPCFQKIEVELEFDKDRKLLEKTITGGKFIEDDEE